MTYKENKTSECFNYSTKTLLSFVETVMLFFKAIPLYKEYEKSFNKGLEYALNKQFKAYKLTFVRNDKLQIDNKLEDLYFLSFEDLINNYFVKNNKYVKKFAKVNFKKKCFVQVKKHYDITYYNVYLLDNKSFEDLKVCFNLTSHKYKANLTKKERKLVYKHKNGLFKNKYSYNLLYFEDLQDNIKSLENKLKDLNNDLLYLDDLFKLNKDLFFKEQDNYIELLENIKTLEDKLKYLKESENNLISSKNKETTLEDYFKFVNVEYKRKQGL